MLQMSATKGGLARSTFLEIRRAPLRLCLKRDTLRPCE